MTVRKRSDSGTFDAADEVSATIRALDADVHILDAGSFSGTIKGYRDMNGTDVEVFSITQADLPYDRVIENAVDRDMYLKCTARSAGSVSYFIGGA